MNHQSPGYGFIHQPEKGGHLTEGCKSGIEPSQPLNKNTWSGQIRVAPGYALFFFLHISMVQKEDALLKEPFRPLGLLESTAVLLDKISPFVVCT